LIRFRGTVRTCGSKQQHSATDDNDAMDIGLIEALQPFDKSVKRLALEAGTLRFGDFQSERLMPSPGGRERVEESRSCKYPEVG